MRRILLTCALLALALPLTGIAATRSPGDGTLALSNVDGYVWIRAKGAMVGRCERCAFRLDDRTDNDLGEPIVTGAKGKDVDDDPEAEIFQGRDVRWRVVGSGFLLRISRGTDIDISVVGRGQFKIRGYLTTNGTYSLNGADPKNVPTELTTFHLKASAPSAP